MKKALAIGINDYQKENDLRGCMNDAQVVSDLLKYRYGFDVQTVLQPDAKSGVLQALDDVLRIKQTESDPVRVLFFAGHGASVLDNATDETDHMDEVLCLSSYHWRDEETFLRDDDLCSRLDAAKAAAPSLVTTVILDCCHSGTGTRGPHLMYESWPEIVARFSESDLHTLDMDDPRLSLFCRVREATSTPTQEGRTKDIRRIGMGRRNESSMSHLLLSACTDAQKAKEAEIDAVPHGVFTLALVRALAKNPLVTYADIHSAVRTEMTEHLDQSPQIEGPDELKARAVFA